MTEQKVGKNQIYYDERLQLWIVEVFEYVSKNVPLYSVYEAYTTKKEAIKVAKQVTSETGY